MTDLNDLPFVGLWLQIIRKPSIHSFASMSLSLRDLALLYEIKRGFLSMFASNGWFGIKLSKFQLRVSIA